MLGLSAVPSAGDPFTVVENEARAREVATYRQGVLDRKRTTSAPVSLENMFANHASTTTEFPLVIKADVQGSVEAIVHALNRLSTDEIKVRVLHSGVGAITESDVTLASASGAPIIGFNVRPNAKAREVAERNKVEFRYYDVIYHLTDWVKGAMAGELGPEIIETVVGRAEVQEVFPAGKKDKAAGLLVLEGVIRKGLNARLTREDVIVSKTTISSLRRFKDDVAEVTLGPRMRRAAGRHQRHQAGRQPRSVRGRGARSDALTSHPPLAGGASGRELSDDRTWHCPDPSRKREGSEVMRRTETPEGRSVRLLRVGEQVRHVLSELLQRGDVHDDELQIAPRQHHRSAHVARPPPRDRVRETAARPGRGSGAEGAAPEHRLPPARGRPPRPHEICREAEVPRRRELRRRHAHRPPAARRRRSRRISSSE